MIAYWFQQHGHGYILMLIQIVSSKYLIFVRQKSRKNEERK